MPDPCPSCGALALSHAVMKARHAQITAVYAELRNTQAHLRQLQGTVDEDYFFRTLWGATDRWTELRIELSSWLFEMRTALAEARAQLDLRRSSIIKASVGGGRPGFDATGAAMEERAAVYDLEVFDERLRFEDAELLVKSCTDLSYTLKAVVEHWHSRRVDIRWRSDNVDGPSAPRRDG